MNSQVKKNYSYHAGQLINKLLASDVKLQLFFNILEDKTLSVNINLIRDILKEVYPVNEKSIGDLNKLLSKYKIRIDTKPYKINHKNLPINNRDIYLPAGYRRHGKVVSIYNRNHLPTVI
jgi:hypothetical protein